MKKILLLMIVLFVLSSCGGGNTEIITKKYYSTGTVFTGSIDRTDSFIGYIEGKETVKISSKVLGRIEKIYVTEGDYVNKGDLLVKFDSIEAKVGYSNSLNVVHELGDLKDTTSIMYDKQIKLLSEKINQAKLGNQGIFDGLDDVVDISSAQLEILAVKVETAQINLNHNIDILKTKENNIYNNSKDAIVNSIILDTNIINFVDILLGITDSNEDKNDLYEDYLSAKNINYLNEAELSFKEVNKKYLVFKDFYDNEIEGKNPNQKIIIKGLNDGEKLAEDLKGLLSIVYDVLDNSIENYYFTLDTIRGYKNDISSYGNELESSLLTISGEYFLGLKGSKQSLVDFEKSSIKQLDLLDKEILLAEKIYNENKASNEGKIRETLTRSKISNSQLKEIELSLDVLKKEKVLMLKEIDIQITEVEGNRNTAGIMIKNGEIKSPIDGIVILKLIDVGEVVGGGISILEVASNDYLKININIPNDKMRDILLGDDVLLNIEGIDKYIVGSVTNIYPSIDLFSKKSVVEISLNNIGNDVKIGSYTKVIFRGKILDNGILISNKSIVSKFMIPGVYVLLDDKVVFRKIEIIKQSDNFSEIRGLIIGDIIIIEGKENMWDGENLK